MSRELEQAVRTILRGFDEGVFVRSVENDYDAGWAIRLFPFIQAIAVAQKIVNGTDDAAANAAPTNPYRYGIKE